MVPWLSSGVHGEAAARQKDAKENGAGLCQAYFCLISVLK